MIAFCQGLFFNFSNLRLTECNDRNIIIDSKGENKMIDIELLRRINKIENIIVTEHARIRLVERNITMQDIIKCIDSGEIIKQYEDDKPFPSCLILGVSINNRYLHIVVSTNDNYIHLITAYYPDLNQWESDYKTRKGRKK